MHPTDPSDQHKRVILLAWATSMGADPQQVLTVADQPGSGPHRFPVLSDHADSEIASVIRIYNITFIYGPSWFLQAANEIDDEILPLESTLIRLGASHGARSLGETTLYYAEDLPETSGSDAVAISEDREFITELEARCPSDDVGAAALSQTAQTFAVVSDQDPGNLQVVAGSGYEEWASLIADLTVLVDPDFRGHGLGTYAVAVAAEEAFMAGLIPQWRAAMGHRAAQRMADAMGFQLSGSQTTLKFEATESHAG